MTTPQPAALPENKLRALYQRHELATTGLVLSDFKRIVSDVLAALQSQPAAARVSDEEISRLWSWSATAEAERTATTQQHAFAYALLALRPQAVPMTDWQPLDAARLNSEEFDGAYWLAMKNGEVAVGEYEWRQGWSPHGFNLIDGGRVGASEITHTATFVRPAHPVHGITAQGAQTKE